MELLDAIRTRRSIREFTSERIPDEEIEKILDAHACMHLLLIGAGHEGFILGRLITTVFLEV